MSGRRPSVGSARDDLRERRANLRNALCIVAAQLGVAVLAAGALLIWSTPRVAVSALAGGAIGVPGSLYLAVRLLWRGGNGSPQRIVRALYGGEAVKILVTAGLFGYAIVRFQPNVPAMLLTYLGTLLVYWFALLFTGRGAH